MIHYRTIGAPRKDGRGIVRNAVLVLHGTTGSGASFRRHSTLTSARWKRRSELATWRTSPSTW